MRRLDAGKSKKIAEILNQLPIFFEWTATMLEQQVLPRISFFACTPQTTLTPFRLGFIIRGRFAETTSVKGTRKLRILEGEGRLIHLDALLNEFTDNSDEKTLVALDESSLLGVFEDSFVQAMKDRMCGSLQKIRDILQSTAKSNSEDRLETAKVITFSPNQALPISGNNSLRKTLLSLTVLRGSFQKLEVDTSNSSADIRTYSLGDSIEARSIGVIVNCVNDNGGAILVVEKAIQISIGTPIQSSLSISKLMDLNTFELPITQRSTRTSRPKVDLGLFTRRSHVHPNEQKAFFECYADPNSAVRGSSNLRTSTSSSQQNLLTMKPPSTSSSCSSSEMISSTPQSIGLLLPLKPSSVLFNKHQRAISLKSTPSFETIDGFQSSLTNLPLGEIEEKVFPFSKMLNDYQQQTKTEEQTDRFVRMSLPEFEDGKFKRIQLTRISDSQSTAASFVDSPMHASGSTPSQRQLHHPTHHQHPRSFSNIPEEVKWGNSLNTEMTDSPRHNWISPTASRGFLKSPFVPLLASKPQAKQQVLPVLINSVTSSRERTNGQTLSGRAQLTPRMGLVRQQSNMQIVQKPCLNDEDLMSLHDDIRSLFSKRNNTSSGGSSQVFPTKLRSTELLNHQSITDNSQTAIQNNLNRLAPLPKIAPTMHYSLQKPFNSTIQLEETNHFDDYLLKQQQLRAKPHQTQQQIQQLSPEIIVNKKPSISTHQPSSSSIGFTKSQQSSRGIQLQGRHEQNIQLQTCQETTPVHHRTANFSSATFTKPKAVKQETVSIKPAQELMFTFYNAPFFVPPENVEPVQ